jgi:branched-chain amino acid transport system permease protein
MILAQLLASGIAVGSLYAMVALGFTLVWNASSTVNFAQGQLVMLGAFIGYTVVKLWAWPYWLAIPAVMVASFAVGVVLERLTIRPVRRLDPLMFIIITIGTAITLESLARNVWGPQTFTVRGISGDALIHFGDVIVTAQTFWIVGIVGLMLIGLYLFLYRTAIGRAMRAAAQDRETAAQMGIPVSLTVALTFGVNGLLAGLAGLLLAPVVFISATMGTSVTLQAFAAAVLGGFGSLAGAVVGGLLLGVVQVLGAATISGAYSDAITLLVLIGVLVVRPRGLFRTSW